MVSVNTVRIGTISVDKVKLGNIFICLVTSRWEVILTDSSFICNQLFENYLLPVLQISYSIIPVFFWTWTLWTVIAYVYIVCTHAASVSSPFGGRVAYDFTVQSAGPSVYHDYCSTDIYKILLHHCWGGMQMLLHPHCHLCHHSSCNDINFSSLCQICCPCYIKVISLKTGSFDSSVVFLIIAPRMTFTLLFSCLLKDWLVLYTLPLTSLAHLPG